jgi:hypothetical protein
MFSPKTCLSRAPLSFEIYIIIFDISIELLITKLNINIGLTNNMVDTVKISKNTFITEKAGNIKDFYKITSCIGRGKSRHAANSCLIGAYGEVRKC